MVGASLAKLDDQQLQQALQALQARQDSSVPKPVTDLKQQHETDRVYPHCQTEGAVRHGSTSNGSMRYRCRNERCRKTFSEFTRTKFERMRKPASWQPFGEALQQRMTLKQTAKHCNISRKTALPWRHHRLGADDEPTPMEGIVEADDTCFAQNSNGDSSIREWHKPRTRGAFSSSSTEP